MSFSLRTKDEVLRQRPRTKTDKRALMSALTHAAGSISLSREGTGVRLVSEHHGVAKLYAQLAYELYDLTAAISITQSEGLRTRNTVVRLTGPACRTLLNDAGCISITEDDGILPDSSVPNALVENDSGKLAFIRGAFLGCGSVTDPGKSYHLEFVCRYEGFSKALAALICDMGINVKHTARKNSFIVYIKDGDDISDMITLLGGMASTLEFEHARIIHGVSNDVNRKNNFDNANMQKAARSAAQQLVDIELIEARLGLHKLPQKLYEAAEARKNNPEATLAELSELMGASKSAVNRRFIKLNDMAAQLRLHND